MAFGSSTFTDLGGAVSDLFAASADQSKAAGDRIEAQDYDLASSLATQNEKFTETSTAIKQAQLDRSIYQTIGGVTADTAGSGFAASGSSLDVLRDSAAQGALTKAVAGQQGLITEAGYTEQATSYSNMANAANMAANAEDQAAKGATIASAFQGAAAIASLFTGGGSNILTGLLGGGGDSGGFTPQAPSNPSNPLVIDRYGKPGESVRGTRRIVLMGRFATAKALP
jgi:hypothetical protein